jgi:iron complex transport system substrate-binding protein
VRPSPYRLLLLTIFVYALSACSQSAGPSSSTAQDKAPGPGQADTRLVTLSPHLAELVYAVGAGDMLVGVSAYTDYPQAATELPIIGDAFALDQERLVMLRADLLLAWDSGTPAHVIDDLRQRGFRVEVIETSSIADVAIALTRIGELTGYVEGAERVAEKFTEDMRKIAAEYADAPSISVFYQVARRPLYTVSHTHYISELIDICGGRNVFADLGNLAPMVGVEAVLARDPEVLLASEDAGPDAFAHWEAWPDMAANRFANKFVIPADEVGRATPRLRVAAKAICDALAEGRNHRHGNRDSLP